MARERPVPGAEKPEAKQISSHPWEADAAALYPGDWERRCRGCYPVFGGVVGYYEEGQGGHICQPCEEYDL